MGVKIFYLLIFFALFISACKRYELFSNDKSDLIDVVKSSFLAQKANWNTSNQGLNFRQSLARTVMWDQAREGKDSSQLIPIKLTFPKDSIIRTVDGAPLNGNIWLYVKKEDNKWIFSMWTLIPSVKHKTRFTGTLLIEDYFDGNFSFSYYLDGKIVLNKDIIKKQNIAKREKVRLSEFKKLAGWGNDCTERFYTICIGNPQDPNDEDICSSQYETICIYKWKNESFDDNQEYIDWIDCSDGGCPNGGGINENKPDSTLKENPDKDPCKGRKAVNERMNKEKIKVMNKNALSNTHNKKVKINNKDRKVEWGYETKFSA